MVKLGEECLTVTKSIPDNPKADACGLKCCTEIGYGQKMPLVKGPKHYTANYQAAGLVSNCRQQH